MQRNHRSSKWTQLSALESQEVTHISALDTETANMARHWQERFLQSANLDELLDMEESTRRTAIEQRLSELIQADGQQLPYRQYNQIVSYILNEALGYGPLSGLLGDPSITEVMVNGPDTIYIERAGKIQQTFDAQFQDDEHLRNIIDRIVSRVGRRIDESSPLVDARLADGSRVNAVIPPLAIDGALLTIRKFQRDPLGLDDLVNFGSLTDNMARFLEACVKARLSILVSGGTGTGKTTLLNALSGHINQNERIATIEDSAELKFHHQHPHVVRMETRPPNVQGAGEITIRNLVKNALRMRPDRIIVGEVRGAEALDMLQAMNTGHEGSMTTVHANSPVDALRRLETMVMWAEGASSLPLSAIREQITSAIDIVIQISRYPNGRKIAAISEVQEMRHGEIVIADIFRFEVFKTEPSTGAVTGHADATGVVPKNLPRLEAQGIQDLRRLFNSSFLGEQLGDLLYSEEVTEIMINGMEQTYVERRGKQPELAPLYFETEAHLMSAINNIIAPLGRRLDERNPYVDARLPDGSRVNAVIPPVSRTGPLLTIRRFPRNPLDLRDLIGMDALSEEMADFLRCAISARFNVLISGGTGTGKTTMLNALSGMIPDEDRIITIEDVAELQLKQQHWLSLEARPIDEFGEGQVTIRDLVINSLRMRPDRIIVGEVRGGETLDMLQAMNTGHEGSMTTVHANSPEDAFYRLETLVSWAGTELPSHTVRAQIVGAIDIIVQLQREAGKRRIVKISEVVKDRQQFVAQDIYAFQNNAYTCVEPKPICLDRLIDAGYRPEIF